MLRFKNDDGTNFPDWEEKSFGDFLITHSEKTSNKDSYPLYSLTIESGVQPKTERYEREFLVKKEGDNYKIVPPNAFVYNPMNLRFGALKVNHEKFSVSVSGYYDVFSLKDDSTLAFWENYLVTPRMLNYYFSIATGSLIEKLRVHYSQFVKIKKAVPSLPEQQKIADFLSTIDTVIEKQKATVEAWEERKKGVMQKLFSQDVRFKADDGSEFPDWEEKKVANLFSKIKEKNKDGKIQNVITNSAEFGLINQRDFFDKDIAVEGKKENYTIIKTGDFVYNPRKSKQAPYGPFNCYQLEEDGIVSPLYTCLRPKSIVNAYYLFWYFQSGAWYRFIYENGAQNGARHDRVGMTDSLMQDIPVYVPRSLEEQQKIADCLSSLDDVIKMQKATLTAWKEMKKGLLQQMFV